MVHVINALQVTLVIIALLLVAVAFYTVAQTMRYQSALAAEGADRCATPAGYTDAEWREHMSHHPDRYAECMK